METKKWVSIHRKHHAKCETDEDPHSPQTRGIKKVFFEGAELYRDEANNPDTLDRYGQGTPDDWLERHIYTKHSAAGIAVMFLIDLVLFGVPGITIWALQMAWIPFFAAGVVNVLMQRGILSLLVLLLVVKNYIIITILFRPPLNFL